MRVIIERSGTSILIRKHWSGNSEARLVMQTCDSRNIKKWCLFIIYLALFLAYASYIRISDIKLWYAWHGWSPILFANKILHPDMFIKDFPSVEIYRNSLTMWIYPIASKYLSISPEFILKTYILADHVLMAVALALLAYKILPFISKWAVASFVILVIASYARTAELSNNGYPMYYGMFYHTAEMLGFLSIALALQRKFLSAWIVASFSFMTHAAYFIGICSFIIGLILAEGKVSLTKRHIVGALFAVCIITYWTVSFVGIGIGGHEQTVPKSIWFTLSKMCQYDFYPFTRRLFAEFHHKHFLPMLGISALSLHYMRRYWESNPEVAKKVFVGQMLVLSIMLAGLAVSEQTVSTFVTRLNLHRAGVLFVTIGMVYVAAGLHEDITEGAMWKKVIAIGLLISPFLAVVPAFPLAFLLTLSMPSVMEIISAKTRRYVDWVFMFFFASAIIAACIYIITGYVTIRKLHGYVGHPEMLIVVSCLGIALWVGRKKRFRFALSKQRVAIILTCLLTFYAVRFLNSPGQKLTPEQRILYGNYLDVQLWAKEHTSADSLFMTDPTVHYGWKDYSNRSSTGGVREWLMTSWLYKMDYATYRRGQQYFSAFGLNLEDYTGRHSWYGDCDRCTSDVGKRFYQMKDEELLDLANRFAIDYFVMKKSDMVNPHMLNIAYENNDFLVIEPRLDLASNNDHRSP